MTRNVYFTSPEECIFCESEGQGPGKACQNIFFMMNEALFAKHSSNQAESKHLHHIDVLLKFEEPESFEQQMIYLKYQEALIQDENQQFLKRIYDQPQFSGKIQMLTEYYKFHKDVPRVIERSIEKILGKYHDKKRQHDYKKIKKVLKEEQGLSITSVQETQTQNSQSCSIEKKSRYSTLLNALQDQSSEHPTMSDSKVLKDMCSQIQRAIPKNKYDSHFKGSFFQTEKIFEDYLKKQEMKNKAQLRQRQKQRQNKINKKFLSKKDLNINDFLKKEAQRYENFDNEQKNEENQKKKSKKEKDRFIYNTNIKIQIRNAMFYSQGENPLTLQNIEGFNSNGNKNQISSQIKKKKNNFITMMNFMNKDESSKRLLGDIYKSTQQNSNFQKRKSLIGNSRERLKTKESNKESNLNIVNKEHSASKRKNSLNPYKANSLDIRKNLIGSSSARKIEQTRASTTKLNTKSLSSTSLKKRSITLSTAKLNSIMTNKKIIGVYERPAVLSMSKYGSSEIKMENRTREKSKEQFKEKEDQFNSAGKKTISIKQLLNRKLALNDN